MTNQLGQETEYQYDDPSLIMLDVFDAPEENQKVTFTCTEFTSLCPKTGQPDYGSIIIEYGAEKLCIESKSLKLYLFAFRNYQGFAETIVNKICDDIYKKIEPIRIVVIGDFNIRGGIGIQAESYRTNSRLDRE